MSFAILRLVFNQYPELGCGSIARSNSTSSITLGFVCISASIILAPYCRVFLPLPALTQKVISCLFESRAFSTGAIRMASLDILNSVLALPNNPVTWVVAARNALYTESTTSMRLFGSIMQAFIGTLNNPLLINCGIILCGALMKPLLSQGNWGFIPFSVILGSFFFVVACKTHFVKCITSILKFLIIKTK